MSDFVDQKKTRMLARTLSDSESDDSDCPGQSRASLKLPRYPWGRGRIVGKRKDLSDSDSSEAENNGEEAGTSRPDDEEDRSVDEKERDTDNKTEDDEDDLPPFVEATKHEYQPYEGPSYSSSSDEEKGAEGDDAATIDYSAHNVKYHISLNGVLPVYDENVKTQNILGSAIGKIIGAKVSDKCTCGCHIGEPEIKHRKNHNKTFVDESKSLLVQCANPGVCNLTDISGANYVGEREKSPKDIIRLRNHAILMGREKHFYMGQVICEYKDFQYVGGDIFLFATMGPKATDMRLVKKDAPPLDKHYEKCFKIAKGKNGDDKAPRHTKTYYVPDFCVKADQKIEHKRRGVHQWACSKRKAYDPKLLGMPYVELYSSKCYENGCNKFEVYAQDTSSVSIYNPTIKGYDLSFMQDPNITDGCWGM